MAEICAGLGVPHETLRWAGWDGRGNLPDRARQARYRLMADWAAARDLADVALGHTADDQAETVLMRLARESGLDGLAAMAPRRHDAGVTWHRPVLGCTRAALRGVLEARGLVWVEDPGNEDPAYTSGCAHAGSLAALEPLGITAEGLAAVARHLRAARDALGAQAEASAAPDRAGPSGDLLIDRDGFAALGDEIAPAVAAGRAALDQRGGLRTARAGR